MTTDTVRVYVRMPKPEHRRLVTAAKARAVPQSILIRTAVARFLDDLPALGTVAALRASATYTPPTMTRRFVDWWTR